jgi:hypothetical protein
VTAAYDTSRELAAALGPAPVAGAPSASWAYVPGGSGARLVPLDTRRVAAASVGARGGARARGRGDIARRLLGAGLRAGLVQPALRRRVRVERSGSIVARLEEALGVAPLAIGVDVGPPRANRKPVLQVFERGGRTIAWAKVGWNAETAALVRHEGDVLARLPAVGMTRVVAPDVLARFAAGGVEVLVTCPLPAPTPGAPLSPPPVAAVRDTALLAPADDGTLAGSAWWDGLRGRLDDATLEIAERALGDAAVTFAGWHGDLSPWNCWWSGERLCVVDWERAGGPVPLGLDAVHGPFLVARLGGGRATLDALDDAVAVASPVLRELGLASDEAVHSVRIAYLAELAARVAGDGRTGPVTLDELRDAIVRTAARRGRAT